MRDFDDFDLRKLVHECREVVVCFESTQKEFRSISARPDEALKLYEAGMTLYFDVLRDSGRAWSGAVAEGLGLRPERLHCSVFASRTGGGLQNHFDAGEGFNLQIRGRKRWLVRANEHVAHPTINNGMAAQNPAELSAYSFDPMPACMPEGAEELEMHPGSVLYVPQGYWHETEARDESVSLNICLHHTSWLDDVLLPALRSTLMRHAKWREWPRGMFGSPAARSAARARLARLLAELPDDLRSLTADCVLPLEAPAEDPRARYARNPLVSLHVDRYLEEDTIALRLVQRRPLAPLRQVEIQLSADLVPACRWLSTRDELFGRAELHAVLPGCPEDEIEELLELLVRQGALLPRSEQ
jgi:50S ribosomal protein L16 3-hydroxylase